MIFNACCIIPFLSDISRPCPIFFQNLKLILHVAHSLGGCSNCSLFYYKMCIHWCPTLTFADTSSCCVLVSLLQSDPQMGQVALNKGPTHHPSWIPFITYNTSLTHPLCTGIQCKTLVTLEVWLTVPKKDTSIFNLPDRHRCWARQRLREKSTISRSNEWLTETVLEAKREGPNIPHHGWVRHWRECDIKRCVGQQPISNSLPTTHPHMAWQGGRYHPSLLLLHVCLHFTKKLSLFNKYDENSKLFINSLMKINIQLIYENY